ncbi:MAG: hypothetical protein ABIL07_04770, partial [candidate division WOR-3 bacterium]
TREDTLNYFKTSIGIDYTFPFRVYGMLEFFYDQSGAVNPSDYEWQKLVTGERQTLAEEYLYLNLSLTHNPFYRPAISSIINFIDRGFILIPQFSYLMSDNVDLSYGVNLFFGPEYSEFKNITPYNGQCYIWLKIYF